MSVAAVDDRQTAETVAKSQYGLHAADDVVRCSLDRAELVAESQYGLHGPTIHSGKNSWGTLHGPVGAEDWTEQLPAHCPRDGVGYGRSVIGGGKSGPVPISHPCGDSESLEGEQMFPSWTSGRSNAEDSRWSPPYRWSQMLEHLQMAADLPPPRWACR